MKNLLFLLIAATFGSCCAPSYITSMKVGAIYQNDGKTIVQVVGLDNKDRETFAEFEADTNTIYKVGDDVSLSPK